MYCIQKNNVLKTIHNDDTINYSVYNAHRLPLRYIDVDRYLYIVNVGVWFSFI